MRYKALHRYWDGKLDKLIEVGKIVEVGEDEPERLALLKRRGLIGEPIKSRAKSKEKVEESLEN